MKYKILFLPLLLLICLLIGCTDSDYDYYNGAQVLTVPVGTTYYYSNSDNQTYYRIVPTPYVEAAVTSPVTATHNNKQFFVIEPQDAFKITNKGTKPVDVAVEYVYSTLSNPLSTTSGVKETGKSTTSDTTQTTTNNQNK